MLEEIKKEIIELNIHECDIEDVFEILDRYKDKEIKFENGSSKYAIVKVPELKIENIKNYNNQPDYKSAWENLKRQGFNRSSDIVAHDYLKDMQELEQKYNIGDKNE